MGQADRTRRHRLGRGDGCLRRRAGAPRGRRHGRRVGHAHGGDRAHGGGRVERAAGHAQPGQLRQPIDVGQEVGLELGGGEQRVARQHERQRPADHRRGHRGAARVDVPAARPRGGDVDPGREQVDIRGPVVREGCRPIVLVGRPDADQVGLGQIAGIEGGARIVVVRSVVARGDHVQRVRVVRDRLFERLRRRRGAEACVDDPGAVRPA